jgi:hypothetical protein
MTMQDVPTESLGRAVLDYLRAHRDEMVALLETLVRAESPSTEPERQAAVQRPLRKALEAMDFWVEHIPGRAMSGRMVHRPSCCWDTRTPSGPSARSKRCPFAYARTRSRDRASST